MSGNPKDGPAYTVLGILAVSVQEKLFRDLARWLHERDAAAREEGRAAGYADCIRIMNTRIANTRAIANHGLEQNEGGALEMARNDMIRHRALAPAATKP